MIKRLIMLALLGLFVLNTAFAEDKPQVKQRRGQGKVKLLQYQNGDWQLLVDGQPYFIKGVVYDPIKVGERLTESNMWMNYDYNNNGKVDTAYESWVDKNNNNLQDKDEPVAGDFQLLKEMGCNTIRIYHPVNIKKEVLRDLYSRFGIRVIMGNLLGAYCQGSGAEWVKGTDYTDPVQCKKMMEDVKKMILEFKDEPFVLFWMLGNENDMQGYSGNSTFNNTNARFVPDVYAKFVNEVIKMIRKFDPNHPVGICNGSTRLIKSFAQFSPELDIIGLNSYRGPFGFGSLWSGIKMDFDRPVVITEYGIDCYDQNKKTIDEDYQARYFKGCWQDMVNNSFGHGGAGNSLGGFLYIWLDSWWLCGLTTEHDTTEGAWKGPAKDGWFNDEWMGVCSQGDGSKSPYLRQLRKVYYMLQKEWRK